MINNAGTDLEIKVSAYFQSYGYYVKRGVSITSGVDNSDVTDIDAVAISFTPTLAEERVIVDCKDKERPKPYERILWVSGLKQYSEANRAVFSAPRIPLHAREFAMRGGVEILDIPSIDARLEQIKHADFGYGAASTDLTAEFDRKWKITKPESKEIRSSYVDMLSTIIYGKPVTNINRIINFTHSIYNLRSSSTDLAWIKRMVCYEGASLFALMLARLASETRALKISDRNLLIEQRLTYGEINPNLISRIFEIAGLGEESMPAPQYSSSVIELMDGLIDDSSINLIAFNTDLYLYGHCILKSGGISQDPKYSDRFTGIELKAKDLISVFSYATQIPIEYFLRR